MSKIIIKTVATVAPFCSNKLIDDDLCESLQDSINGYCKKNYVEFVQIFSANGTPLIIFKTLIN